jgi:hypothetical protein
VPEVERLSLDGFLAAMKEHLDPVFAKQKETWQREGPAAEQRAQAAGIVIDSIGGNCPVQAEGSFDGMRFYFRARPSPPHDAHRRPLPLCRWPLAGRWRHVQMLLRTSIRLAGVDSAELPGHCRRRRHCAPATGIQPPRPCLAHPGSDLDLSAGWRFLWADRSMVRD